MKQFTSVGMCFVVAPLVVCAIATRSLAGGSLEVTSRQSVGRLSLFAGSGGAVSQFLDEDESTALNGPFAFSASETVFVTETMPASNGAATSTGSLGVTDSVVSSPTSLLISATRNASGMSTWGSGTGNGTATIVSELTVEFTVIGQSAAYSLVGNFDPGANNGVGAFRIGRPFASFDIVDINGVPATLDQSGFLPPNAYQFRLRITDMISANANTAMNSDASSFDIRFELNAIPEPGSLLLLAIGTVSALRRR